MVAGENLLANHLNAKYAQPERRTLCPECAYPLEETDKGLHCRACGWSENASIRFIPRTPDNPTS